MGGSCRKRGLDVESRQVFDATFRLGLGGQAETGALSVTDGEVATAPHDCLCCGRASPTKRTQRSGVRASIFRFIQSARVIEISAACITPQPTRLSSRLGTGHALASLEFCAAYRLAKANVSSMSRACHPTG